MAGSNNAAFTRHVLAIIFSAPGADAWNSWDDAYRWVQDHPDLIGGPSLAWRYMEALARTQRRGVPFTRDLAEAAHAIELHLGPIEDIHECDT